MILNKKNKLLILGASRWHIPWLLKAKSLGFTVFATDWSADAEGREIPHFFAPIDLRDKEATLAYARQHEVNAIFTSADIGVQTAAYVAKNMGLPCYSEELAYCATNKFAMREKAKAIGLGIPKYTLVQTIEEAINAAALIEYPLIIKPVDNFSSKGICVVYNQLELEQQFPKSMEASFVKRVLVEEFMQGDEGSVEALVRDGVVHIMGVCKKQKSPLPYRYDVLLEYPGHYSVVQQNLIKQFVDDLVTGFEIKNGIIHVEIMVANDIKLIEFAIRGCGSLVTTHLMPALTHYDVMDYLLWNAFGISKPIQFSSSLDYGVLKFIMLPKGELKCITGKANVQAIPGILAFDIERKSGDIITEVLDGRSRPGYLLAHASSKDLLKNIVDDALSKYTVEYA